jgi:hypothetical protein
MPTSEPYAFFRHVLESDLPHIAQCIGAGAGLPYARWNNILNSLQLQFEDAEDSWRPHTWVMVVEGRPIFLLEEVGQQIYFTGPPSWGDHSRRMMLAWQASLVHFFIRLHRQEVRIVVQAYRQAELKALERLGCEREGLIRDKSGTHYLLVCRPEAFTPVI